MDLCLHLYFNKYCFLSQISLILIIVKQLEKMNFSAMLKHALFLPSHMDGGEIMKTDNVLKVKNADDIKTPERLFLLGSHCNNDHLPLHLRDVVYVYVS